MDFYDNQQFFEPDVDAFAVVLKQLYTDINLRLNLGQQAASDIKNKWDWSTVCAPIKRRLIEIHNTIHNS